MLDYRVKTFLKVCETMNYTQASHALNITQPAVSQHIRGLENYYGVRLFKYENKTLRLTPAGAVLRDRMRVLQNDEEALTKEIQQGNSALLPVSLGVTMTVGEYAVVRPLARYLKRHPEQNIRLRFGNTTQLLKLLQKGEIQLALVEGYYPKDKYEHLRYSTEEYVGVCRVENRSVGEVTESFADLLTERLLVREEGSGTRNILERCLAVYGLKVSDFQRQIQVENMHTIIGLLKEGCGISFLYKIAVEEELRTGVLRELRIPDFHMTHDFDFIWEKGSLYSDGCRAFGEELRALRG